MSSFHEDKDDLLLAINGTEETLQIIIARREEEDEPYTLLEAKTLVVPGRSVNFMVPSIQDSLRLFEFDPADISRIALIAGPGSFTGLRLTFSAAAGIIAGNNGLISSMEYLPILATGPAVVTGLPVWTITHCRKMMVYIQGFEPIKEGETSPAPITPPLPVSVQEAVEVMLSYKQEKAVLAGTGLVKNKDFFEPFLKENPQYSTMPERFNVPDVQDVIKAAQEAEYSREMPMPMYLRGSDAEENLESITSKRGIPLEIARERLKNITPR